MYRGGSAFSKRSEWIIRVAGVTMPVLLIIYGLFVRAGIVDNSHYMGDLVFILLMSVWVVVAIEQILTPPKNVFVELFRLTSYHILSALYILFISGFEVPFLAAWILLLFASHAYFSITGVVANTAVFIATGILDVLLYGSRSLIIDNGVSVIAILAVGLTIVGISKTQEIDNAELMHTKALETLQRDRILTLINNLADAIMSTDKDGVIRVYNAACLNLLDTNSNLNDQSVNDVLKFHDVAGKPLNIVQELKKSRGVVVRDDITMTLDEEVVRLEITLSPIRSSYSRAKAEESNDGYIIIMRDITKAKSLEEERDEFISVVSHELRTPITVAEGTISNVQVMMSRPQITQDTLKQGIETAHEQILFLAKMVNDLSTLSRAERGVADTPETIDVRHMIEDLYNEYAPQAEKKNLHFDLDLSSHLGSVNASQLYLKELLQNFITNALKYTKEGSITLRVARHDNRVTFEVKDTGIGISKSDQTKIFNKFYRSEDYRTRETGGTGLGLYVAAKLAKKLGAKIKLVSRLNHGSSFSIDLPIEKKATTE